MSTTANRIIKNTGFLYAKMGITMFISLYTTRLVLNSLGASDFGIFNIVGGSIALLGFLNSSLAGSTQRFMSHAEGEGNQEKQKYIFNISIILHFLLGLFMILALIGAGFVFFNGILNIPDDRSHAAIIVYCSLIVSTAFTVMSVPYEAVLNAHENMKYYAFVGILESLLKFCVAIACVYTLSDKLIVYGFLMALVPIVTLTIMRIYCHKNYQECIIAPRRYYNHKQMREMTSFAGWNFLSSAAAILTMQGMAILLNMFGGVIVNTAHGIANQLTGQIMVFSNNMLKALNPVLVKSHGAGMTNQMLHAAETGNKLSFGCFAFFSIPFIVETPYILSLWLKQVPLWAVLFCRLVMIRQMISQTYITFETCVKATGNIRNMTINSTFLWSFPIIIGYILYKHGAPIYTIYLLLIVLAFLRGANVLYFSHKLCGLHVTNYLCKTFIPLIGTCLFLMGLLYFIKKQSENDFIQCVTIFGISSILYSFLFYKYVLNTNERSMLSRVLISIKSRFGQIQ